jgi:hypothetical protein
MVTAPKAGQYLPVWTFRSDHFPHDKKRSRSVMGRMPGTCAWLLALATLGCPLAQAAEGLGPLPVRNFQPFQMLTLGMFGDRATVLKPGALDIRIELAETNSIFREETNPPLFTQVQSSVKIETLRSGLFLRYGTTKRLEIGMELPLMYRYHGFMEGLITATERATTGVTGARTLMRGSGYVFSVSREGRTLFQGGDGHVGIGDLTLISKYQLLGRGDRTPAVSVRFAIKAPTGDRARTFGSGHPDFGLGLAAEHGVGRRWVLYANVNGVFPTGEVAGLDLRPTFSGLAAAEYLWSDKASLLAQFQYYSSPFHDTGLKMLDRGITETAVGFNYKLRPSLLWQVYGIENIDFITGSAADFTLSTVMTYHFESR